MPADTTTTSIRIPIDLLARFDRIAAMTERTRSYHVVKALAAYVAEQEYLHNLVLEATAEADADPTALPNAEAIATGVAQGLLRADDLTEPDPVSDDEYVAAQARGTEWR